MKLVKHINRARVLALLRDGQALSRVRMKEVTGLNGTTITNLTRDLMRRRLVLSKGYEPSTGGRRPELLALNRDWKFTLGVYLGPRRVYGVLVNLRGETMADKRAPLEPGASDRQLLAAIEQVALSLCRRVAPSRLLGAGMAVTGMFDASMSVLAQSVFFPSLVGRDLKSLLRSWVARPVELDCGTRCMALAEGRFGAANGLKKFIYLQLGIGIGCAILTDGKLDRGASMSAGELGHTIAVQNGRICPCGKKGCLETVASVGALLRDVREALNTTSITFDDIVSMCDKGNPDVMVLVRRVGQHIGLSVSRLVSVLNPSHVVIGGDLTRLGAPLIDSIDAALREYASPAAYGVVKLVGSAFSQDVSCALGAATLIMDKVFDSPLDGRDVLAALGT